MKHYTCPACQEILRLASPVDKEPSYRCYNCNLRIIISNPSSMESVIWRLYWKIVNAGAIGDYNESLPPCKKINS